jgi:Sec-independent protein translocase protein TatA
VGFGMEMVFVLVLGLMILGPKRWHTLLTYVARAKAELENATRGMKSQLATELHAAHEESRTGQSLESSGKAEPSRGNTSG